MPGRDGTRWDPAIRSSPRLTSPGVANPLPSPGRAAHRSACWIDCFTHQHESLTNRNPPRVGSTAEIELVCRSYPAAKEGLDVVAPTIHTHLYAYTFSQWSTRPEHAARPALPRNTDHTQFQPSRASSTGCSRPRPDSDAVTTRLATEPIARFVSSPSAAWPGMPRPIGPVDLARPTMPCMPMLPSKQIAVAHFKAHTAHSRVPTRTASTRVDGPHSHVGCAPCRIRAGLHTRLSALATSIGHRPCERGAALRQTTTPGLEIVEPKHATGLSCAS